MNELYIEGVDARKDRALIFIKDIKGIIEVLREDEPDFLRIITTKAFSITAKYQDVFDILNKKYPNRFIEFKDNDKWRYAFAKDAIVGLVETGLNKSTAIGIVDDLYKVLGSFEETKEKVLNALKEG